MENQESSEQYSKLEEFLKTIEESVEDSIEGTTRMALFFIILREKEVTVDYLRTVLGIKGNTIYYHLNKLEDVGILSMKREAVPGTNLSRKIFYINPHFFQLKKEQEWKILIKNNPRLAFLAEMYIAVGALVEALRTYLTMSDDQFNKYYKEKKPICDVLFLKEDQFSRFHSLASEIIQEISTEDVSKILEESEGYVYSIFAYPPVNN
ncbi:MAG: winged helix-turn-helix domain-containing protein [Promethearchaeota archaeon]